MVWSRDGPGVGPVAVYARVAYSCTYGAGLRPLGVSSAHRPSFSGHTLLCVPHIEKKKLADRERPRRFLLKSEAGLHAVVRIAQDTTLLED